jgi:uncharacterized OB-fold protein
MNGSAINGSRLIMLQRCLHCSRLWYTPLPACPYCAGQGPQAEEHDGAGTIYSWTTVHRSLEDPPAPVPYTILTVDLDVGAKVHGRLAASDAPEPGAAVTCIEARGAYLVFTSAARNGRKPHHPC